MRVPTLAASPNTGRYERASASPPTPSTASAPTSASASPGTSDGLPTRVPAVLTETNPPRVRRFQLRHAVVATALLAVLAPTAAHAEKRSIIAVERPPARAFDGVDFVGGTFFGAAAGVVGALSGVMLVGALADCPVINGECSVGQATFLATGAIGGALGVALGVYGYGELSHHDGSFALTLAGASLGALGAYGLISVADGMPEETPRTVLLVTSFLLPVAGGLAGYSLSNRVGGDVPTSGALLDLSPDRGLRVSVPAVDLAFTREGEVTVSLPLFGGTL